MAMKFNWIPMGKCMVMQINKNSFISELSRQLSYSREKCIIINDILESNFFISKKNKDKIIDEFRQILNVSNEESIKIYDIAVKIIKDKIKDKLKHPFENQD